MQTICGAAFLRGLSDRQTIRPTAAAKDDSDTKRRTDRCKAAPIIPLFKNSKQCGLYYKSRLKCISKQGIVYSHSPLAMPETVIASKG